MSKILFINPSKWGRGITPIWIASHSAVLKKNGHNVKLFDATFYSNWADNENSFNTNNKQYKPSDYDNYIDFCLKPVEVEIKKFVENYKPDFIFFSAISSHIHGEGEYISIQLGHKLIENINSNAIIICGGLQATEDPKLMAELYPKIDYLIGGESEFVLLDLIKNLNKSNKIENQPGVFSCKKNDTKNFKSKQEIISDMDLIGIYDYSLFDKQIFYRPYNGRVLKAIDYEISRGCPFTCSYCVETVIQRYYNFLDTSNRGSLLQAKKYLRSKSAKRIFEEIKTINKKFDIELFRLQDTNFLTVNRKVLIELSDLIANSDLDIIMYIETRPEGINEKSIELLKKLKVDGVGMGIELSTQSFREEKLNRFANQDAIKNAFILLNDAGIKRTAYNIIGLPEQDENSIIETINFNRMLDPDNITVAFYSPYLGTGQQKHAVSNNYFLDYEFNVDSQLRTMTKHKNLSKEKLKYYKENFVNLVKNKEI